MPLVRGRVIPETESTGRAKKALDILLWIGEPKRQDLLALNELDILRVYLRSMNPPDADIRIYVPADHAGTIKTMKSLDIEFAQFGVKDAPNEIQELFKAGPADLAKAVAAAQALDIDCIATNDIAWLPFIPDVEKLSILLTDCTFLLPYSEVFVRGHGIPWAFSYKVWDEPWTAFYQLAEERSFKPGLELLHKAYQQGAGKEAQETGRSLVLNRIANLCFTRDRLFWYEIQRMVSKRRGWKRQRFAVEICLLPELQLSADLWCV